MRVGRQAKLLVIFFTGKAGVLMIIQFDITPHNREASSPRSLTIALV
jgi:hypothetical protein